MSASHHFVDGEQTECQVEYDRNNAQFTLFDNKSTVLAQYKSPLDIDSEYDASAFTLQLLHGTHLSENNIYHVYAAGKRIGWIFPLQALLSGEHDFATDVYFLKYAYVGIYLLLRSQTKRSVLKALDEFDWISLDSLISSDSIMLILSSENCSTIPNFKIENYIISLFENGYTFNKWNPNTNDFPHLDKRLSLKPISPHLENHSFILELFERILPNDNIQSVTRFHLLYQVIEILIHEVFVDKFKSITTRLECNPTSLFDLKDNLSKIAGEKHRVTALFDCYSSCQKGPKESLQKSCNSILRKSGRRECDSVSDSLYAVRCLLFHDYKSIPAENRDLVDDINIELTKMIIELLYSFQTPCEES